MQSNEWEVIVLKPTRFFARFLATLSPEIEMPSMMKLQENCTAYVIRKQKTDEDTLNEIERHFMLMFKNEICRWLDNGLPQEVDVSFLDFLCCFKFEMHSQIILLEDSLAEGKQLLRIKPRSVLLKWMKNTAQNQENFSGVFDHINLSQLSDNATAVIKNFDDVEQAKSFLKDCYQPLFEAEMARMCDNQEQWPEMDSYQTFSRYFIVDTHTQLIHLN